MKTFHVQTLGCKVNQYEGEQLAALLRARGLIETSVDRAELRIINSCSVTVQAASQSRQAARRMVRLPVLSDAGPPGGTKPSGGAGHGIRQTDRANRQEHPSRPSSGDPHVRPRVIITGCWATSDKAAAAALQGVDAALTHQDNLADELDRLLRLWEPAPPHDRATLTQSQDGAATRAFSPPSDATIDDGWMIKAGSGAGDRTHFSRPEPPENVNENSFPKTAQIGGLRRQLGANSLPLLGEHQTGRQRAFLKIQDGCDAHCTYCIIPNLRPALHSKTVEDAVEEATRLVATGHVEIVLTGIFLGAYGQPTALRRRQSGGASPLASLVRALCDRVPGLRRLRLSSLEPGDLTPELLAVLRDCQQVVPHFHLPLQSGSDKILRRMNRQYRRDAFLRMVDEVNAAFDRPALTTDVIVGFPGESDAEFEQTVDVANKARFIHIHAFPFSPRPGTAAARWDRQFVRGPVVNQRIERLREIAQECSYAFRSQFVGEWAEVVVEQPGSAELETGVRGGRCERYFRICFDGPSLRPGELVRVQIQRVTRSRTHGVASALA